jgi:hypothetical protein
MQAVAAHEVDESWFADWLRGLLALEPQQRQVEVLHETAEVGRHAVVVVGEQRGRGDVAGADERCPVQEERDDAALVGESADVARDPQPVDGAHSEGYVVGQ